MLNNQQINEFNIAYAIVAWLCWIPNLTIAYIITQKIERVKALFLSSGAADATQQAIQDFTFKAFETLEKMQLTADKKKILQLFGEKLMNRNVQP